MFKRSVQCALSSQNYSSLGPLGRIVSSGNVNSNLHRNSLVPQIWRKRFCIELGIAGWLGETEWWRFAGDRPWGRFYGPLFSERWLQRFGQDHLRYLETVGHQVGNPLVFEVLKYLNQTALVNYEEVLWTRTDFVRIRILVLMPIYYLALAPAPIRIWINSDPDPT